MEDSYAAYFTASDSPKISDEPGTSHVHFFWDTVPPENAGTNGKRPREWILCDGPSPFTLTKIADRPPGATKICALVADNVHGITPGTGNCADLPEG